MKNNRGEFLYATLRIPIVDFVTRSTVKRSRNNMLISQLEKDETMRKLQSDIEQAVMDCNGYAKEITQMENKVDADSLAFHATSRKFEEGMQSAIDLYTSANTLLLSRVTLLQKRMLYVLKDRLVDYYKGESLIKQ
jgi:outer membrane protein